MPLAEAGDHLKALDLLRLVELNHNKGNHQAGRKPFLVVVLCFFFCFVLNAGSHYVGLAVLELTS